MNRRDFFWAAAALGGAAVARTTAPARSAGTGIAPTAVPAATPPGSRAGSGELWLNWNESPLGLAPAAHRAALSAVGEGHLYPDAAREELKAALAARHAVGTDSVVLGCGSTELLQIVVQAAVAEPPAARATLVLADPTFEAIARYQRPHGFRVERVPLAADFAHDLDAMRNAARRASGPVVVYLCNPNNPTATLTPSDAIDAWIGRAREGDLFVVDEAYFEFVDAPAYRSATPWVSLRPNVVVTRTFSKIYGMAGLRLGYALAHPETAARLRALRANDNANAVALAAARAALADDELVPRGVASNAEARRVALATLAELGLAALPSHANFLMHRVPGDLGLYIERMREDGIHVGRPFPPLTGYNRLSLGTPEQMERWAETLRRFRDRGWV